jgi:hypothetical protein
MQLKDPPNLNTLKVVICFPDGDRHCITFEEMSRRALADSDLSFCPILLKNRIIERGSLTFVLIEDD